MKVLTGYEMLKYSKLELPEELITLDISERQFFNVHK
jgi:hypothetical protein